MKLNIEWTIQRTNVLNLFSNIYYKLMKIVSTKPIYLIMLQ